MAHSDKSSRHGSGYVNPRVNSPLVPPSGTKSRTSGFAQKTNVNSRISRTTTRTKPVTGDHSIPVTKSSGYGELASERRQDYDHSNNTSSLPYEQYNQSSHNASHHNYSATQTLSPRNQVPYTVENFSIGMTPQNVSRTREYESDAKENSHKQRLLKYIRAMECEVEKMPDNISWEKKYKSKESECQELQSELFRCKQKIVDLSNRLAAEMGTKVASNESSIENVSIKVRPMRIAEDYHSLCSDEWLAAKSFIDLVHSDLTEETKLQFLCNVLMISQSVAAHIQKNVINEINERMMNPLQADNQVDKRQSRHIQQNRYAYGMSRQLLNSISDDLRSNSENTNLSPLIATVELELQTKHSTIMQVVMHAIQHRTFRHNDSFTKYVQVCAEISWKMVNQRPPMTFYAPLKGSKFQPDTQEINWNSDDPSRGSVVVTSCAFPVLYHSDKVMVKGKVLLKQRSRSQSHDSARRNRKPFAQTGV